MTQPTETATPKRYVHRYVKQSVSRDMFEDENGDWVHYDDYVALRAQLAQAQNRLQEYATQISMLLESISYGDDATTTSVLNILARMISAINNSSTPAEGEPKPVTAG